MSKYVLLNKEVIFTDSEDRYCALQFFAWDAVKKAKKEFDAWYVKQENIYNVLKNFADEVEFLLEKHAINPLYKTLSSDYEIYDLSQTAYSNRCLNLSSAQDIHDEAIEIYEGIEEQLEEERAYREFRKASRSEVVGGGFGVGGMLKGMATAGAINMATGAAHSIANSIGNAGSESDARQAKAKLYDACREDMPKALESCILSTVYAHIYVVNDYITNYITPSFDSEKAGAYLESAKSVETKRIDLLVDAFKCCPWNYELYSFIFETYPKERKNLIAISKDFRVDLEDEITELLSKEYTSDAKKTEALALAAKKRILDIMNELGVTENEIIDEIEFDCLERLCRGYEKADEKTCKELTEKVKEYQALEKNKTYFLEKLQERIEIIWAKEDGEVFDNYLITVDVLNREEIEKGIQYIEEKGRTSDAKKYLEALEMFKHEENIKKARMYRIFVKEGIVPKLLKWSGALLAILGLILYLVMDDFSLWLHGFPIIAGIAVQIYILALEADWDKITVHNKAIHPILTMSNEEYAKLKSKYFDEHFDELVEKEVAKEKTYSKDNEK